MNQDEASHLRLAQFLKAEESRLVTGWVDRVAHAVASPSVDRRAIENSVRQVLADVRTALVGRDPDFDAAKDHGEQRYKMGFHLVPMMREFALLIDQVEQAAADADIGLSATEVSALSRHVAAGLVESVSTFVEEQRIERQRQAHRHAGFLAHELRNPLQAMSLALEALKRGTNPGAAVEVLGRSIESVLRRIDSSLNLAREGVLGEGGPEPQVEEFDLAQLGSDILRGSETHAAAQGLALQYEGPQTCAVGLDPILTESILSNLIRNAIKFSERGGQVILRIREDPSRVLIEVQDHCGGLSASEKARMFGVFTQMSRDRSGYGLGLAITRQAVVAQRGSVQVLDIPDGCTFVVTLPADLRQEPERSG